MAHVKKQLLEYLIRQCVKEVLEQVSEGDEADAVTDMNAGNEEEYYFKKYGKEKSKPLHAKSNNKQGKIKIKGKEIPPSKITEDETVGAASPPADGLGTAEQPALPKKPTSVSETKLKKEWINVKEGKSLSPEINELKQAIKRIVREVFSE